MTARTRKIKRLFDITASVVLLVVFSPLLLILSVVIAIFLGRPVFFRQQRPGLLGRPFLLVKFRSMSDARDSSGALKPDAARLGRLGSALRAMSLDELPELWNVLKGDMSLVGPRPLLMEYLPLYSAAQARRHEVRPGLTGWAQIQGRNNLSWEEKFAFDVWYIDHHSFSLDLRILWATLSKVMRAEGISQSGHVTMERFRGSAE